MSMSAGTDAPAVDAVIVSYNSADTLRGCVEPLSRMGGVAVTVVDNDSPEDPLPTIADLPVRVIRSGRNGGFGFGCNLGTAAGSAPYVLFLNPDAQLDRASLERMCAVLDGAPDVAVVGPRTVDEHGALHHTQRNFPRVRSSWAQALFLHRVFRRARWTDEVIWDAGAYERPGSPEWLSGSCLLVRRSALEAIGGFDERFFLYCEDVDLCHRLRDAGHAVRYEPAALARHVGGASAPRGTTLPIYARSRVLYARKYYRRPAVVIERVGVAVGELTHAAVSLARPAKARAHVLALQALLRPVPRGGEA
jgi:N-acetylglucosaminyl-diphospho-decaprenol L-rhamnosyltransferase